MQRVYTYVTVCLTCFDLNSGQHVDFPGSSQWRLRSNVTRPDLDSTDGELEWSSQSLSFLPPLRQRPWERGWKWCCMIGSWFWFSQVRSGWGHLRSVSRSGILTMCLNEAIAVRRRKYLPLWVIRSWLFDRINNCKKIIRDSFDWHHCCQSKTEITT